MSSVRRKAGARALLAAVVVTGVAVAAVRREPLRLGAATSAAVTSDTVVPSQGAGTHQAVCRVEAGPIQAVAGNLQATIRNSGTAPAILSSLEFGWSGERRLTTVTARLDDGSFQSLWSESVASPALLTVGDGLALEPGEGAELTIGFDGEAPAITAIGPLLATFKGGCLVPLVGDAPKQCEVGVSAPSFPSTAPFSVEFEITNPTTNPLLLAAIRLTWPSATNGSLVSLRLDGTEAGLFEPGRVTSPARLDLNRLIGMPARVPPTGSVRFRAQFENPVDNNVGSYRAGVDDVTGCLAASDPGSRGESCGIRILGLEAEKKSVRLQMVNLEPVTRTVEALDLYWPADTVGPLREVRGDGGRVLWSGEAAVSPVHLPFGSGPSVRPGGRGEFVFAFRNELILEDSRTMSTGSYSVVAHLGGECRTAYSTRLDEPSECALASADLVVDGARASVSIANTGPAVRLEEIGATWPLANGALESISMGQDSLWTGVAGGRSLTVTVPAGVPASLVRGARQDVVFGFANQAVPAPYALTMSFVGETGQACRDILVSVRPAAAECQLTVGPVSALPDARLGIALDNSTEATALQLIELAWSGGTSLMDAQLEVPDGTSVLLWRGDTGATSPTRLVPDVLTVAEVGASRLVLRFSQDVDPAGLSIHVVADGCQAGWSPPGGEAKLPEVNHLNGWIGSLPTAGLHGWWALSVLAENTSVLRQVWVDGGTRFDPPNIDPEIGDMVTVDIARDATSRDRALRVRFQRPPFVEVRGTVASITGTSRPEQIVVNNQTIHVGDAVVDGRLVVGAVVTVQGTVAADGAIVAMRVAVVDTRVGDYVEFRGVVQGAAVDPDTAGLQLWNVDGRRVRVDAELAGLPSSDQLPSLGSRVWVKGRIDADVVRVVDPGDSAEVLGGIDLEVINGIIVQLPIDGIVGPWLITDGSGGSRRVAVPSSAVVDERVSRAEAGALIRAIVDDAGDGLIAVRIRVVGAP